MIREMIIDATNHPAERERVGGRILSRKGAASRTVPKTGSKNRELFKKSEFPVKVSDSRLRIHLEARMIIGRYKKMYRLNGFAVRGAISISMIPMKMIASFSRKAICFHIFFTDFKFFERC